MAKTLDRKKIGGKKPTHIFEWEGEGITLDASIDKSGINKRVNIKMPFLPFLAINYNLPVIAEVQEWFESCIVRNYANPIVENRIMISEDNFIIRITAQGKDIYWEMESDNYDSCDYCNFI